MEQKLILDIIDSVDTRLWWMLWKFIVAGIIGMAVYGLMTNVVAYIMLLLNKDLNKGVEIRINNKDGVILDYGISFIRIKLRGGNDLLIPIGKWKQQNWEIKDCIAQLYGYEPDGKE